MQQLICFDMTPFPNNSAQEIYHELEMLSFFIACFQYTGFVVSIYIYIYICMYTHKYVSFLGGLEQNLKSLKRRYSIQPFVCNVGDIYLRPWHDAYI